MRKITLFLSVALFSACTTHRGFVNYQEIGVYASSEAGNRKFSDVGPVNTSASSWVWSSCDFVATEAVRDLLDISKTRGGNTVYNIRFDSESGQVSTPTCFKRWGFFILYLVPGLGPWMTATSVSGVAAKLDGEKPVSENEIRFDNSSDLNLLAEKFVSMRVQKDLN
jgi:hypothetical protein